MNNNIQLATTDALDFLFALDRDSTLPEDAREQLKSLRSRHPDLALNLLSEVQAYDRSVHYDVLLRQDGQGTVSLSFCPERATPWPLRGVHRWSDADLLRVNANVLRVDEAIAFLDFIWEEAPIADQLINQCILREELSKGAIEISEAELQVALDDFRVQRKLFRAEDMHRWLEEHGMTHENLERYVGDNCLIGKLRDRVTADRVEEYFHEHHADFDTVQAACIEFSDEVEARDSAAQIADGTQDFWTVAERRFQETANAERYRSTMPFVVFQRRQTRSSDSDVLFAAKPGQVVGPVSSGGGYAVYRVLAVQPARLDDRVRECIQEILFHAWLADRRQEAQIEWCWGNASKTG